MPLMQFISEEREVVFDDRIDTNILCMVLRTVIQIECNFETFSSLKGICPLLTSSCAFQFACIVKKQVLVVKRLV